MATLSFHDVMSLVWHDKKFLALTVEATGSLEIPLSKLAMRVNSAVLAGWVENYFDHKADIAPLNCLLCWLIC